MKTQGKINLPRRYQRLLEIARHLASTLDLDVLLERIVHAAAELSGAQESSILLYDDIKKELHFEVATNMNQPLMRGIIVPVDSSLAGWIVINRKPVIIADTSQDERHFGRITQLTQIKTSSLVGVPLITKNKVIGVLEAINKRSGEFTTEDLGLLEAFAAQAAVAIENARLFQQSDLISELVHELRTPMASLSTAAHLLLRPDLPDEQRSRIVEIIHDETFRISDLASSFLDLARLESGRAQFRFELFDVRRLLEDCDGVMRSRAVEKGLNLILQLPPDLGHLKGDRDKLKQVVLNLLSNAIKYNSPNGTITLSAQRVAGELEISVTDTGPGISEAEQAHLFEKFYRTPGSEKVASGTGLGLSICKRIVEAHRGRITVQSKLGVGTTFTVSLPLDPLL